MKSKLIALRATRPVGGWDENMEKVTLTIPTVSLEAEYRNMIKDWESSGEGLVPFVLEYDNTDFAALVIRCMNDSKGINLPIKGREIMVPHSTFWLTDENNTILGVVNIRHKLNESLRKVGGHIGYGIRPSQRRKGYANRILHLALNEAEKMGMEEVMLSCFKDNASSAKSIMNNGGILEEEKEFEGKTLQNYWIKKT